MKSAQMLQFFIACCVLLLFVNCEYTLFEGDPCVTESTEGKCTLLSDCEYAKNVIKKKRSPPKTCGFKEKIPIVCCLDGVKNNSEISIEPGVKSRAKCDEYQETPVFPIVLGESSKAMEFPHMALLGSGDPNNITWLCGGSLISEQFVLTAAHCISSQFGNIQYVRLGELDLNSTTDEAEPQDFEVVETFVHPNFKPPLQYYDIALLKLSRRARFTFFVRLACLQLSYDIPQKSNIIATGWGKTNFLSPTINNHLLKTNLNIVDHAQCSKIYPFNSSRRLPQGILDESQVCAGSPEGKDTCSGDSGGPLQFLEFGTPERPTDKNYVIVGITSFGKGCGGNAVYTRVSNFVPWIESIVWPD